MYVSISYDAVFTCRVIIELLFIIPVENEIFFKLQLQESLYQKVDVPFY